MAQHKNDLNEHPLCYVGGRQNTAMCFGGKAQVIKKYKNKKVSTFHMEIDKERLRYT